MQFHNSAGIVWRSDLVLPYESLWSLWSKFALLNLAAAQDTWRLFRSELAPSVLAASYRDLRRLSPYAYWNAPRIANAMRLRDNDLSLATVEPFLGPVGAVACGAVTADHLRYCPECIRAGYHSACLQVRWVAQCPIHGQPLLDACPRCGSSLPYTFDAVHAAAYGCPCGHQFWDRATVPEATKVTDCITPLLEWSIAVRRGQMRDNVALPCETALAAAGECHVMRIPTYWKRLAPIPACFARSNPLHASARWGGSFVMPASPGGSGRPASNTSEPFDRFLRGRSDHIRAVYKTVTSHVLRRVLRDHRVCIRAVTHIPCIHMDAYTEPVCACAHAYILWRMFWEGRSRPTSVDREPTPNPLHLDRHPLLSGMLRTPILDIHPDIERWLLARACGLIFLATFVECLSVACHDSQSGYACWLPDERVQGKLCPFVRYEAQDAQLHWWWPEDVPQYVGEHTVPTRAHFLESRQQARVIADHILDSLRDSVIAARSKIDREAHHE